MKASVYTFMLSLLILSLTAAPLEAQDHSKQRQEYPDREEAIDITELDLLGQPTKGATVRLRIRFRAHVDGPGTLTLRYPKHIAPAGRQPGEKSRTESLSLAAGTETVKTYPLRVEEAGASMVSVIIRADEVPENYDESASEHINVVSGTGSKAKKSDLSPRVYTPGDTSRRRVSITRGATTKTNVNAQSYTVSISGKVEYLDKNEFPDRMEGLYGSKVELWFRDSSTPDQLYHPVLGDTEHTHYDVVEEDGQYHFNFSFSGDLSGYDELLVLVQTSNDAASLSVGQGAWIIKSGSGTETFFGPQQGVAYDISGMGTTISISNADAEVNSKDGAVLRNMQLSREFARARYDNNAPFNLPTIMVYRESIAPAGVFCEPEDNVEECTDRGSFPYIILDIDDTDLELSAHEFGHYLIYRMWGGGDGPRNGPLTTQLAEGWAIFVSFAARNYANDTYGDNLDKNEDNTETAPFKTGTGEDGNQYRFINVGYAYGGNPSYAAFACYLWNLYDGYNGGSFEASPYDLGDNDDVGGYANRVFEVFRTLQSVAILEQQTIDVPLYRFVFKEGYYAVGFGPLANEVKTSVSSIGTFMFSNLTQVPNTPMRPAQLTNPSGQIQSNGNIEFQWSQRTYPTGHDYGNYPDGYRIRRGGQSVATVPFGTTSYTYSPEETKSADYRLTAYNANGEAQAAPVLDLLDVSITSGPTVLDEGELGTWTASASRSGASFTWYANEGAGWSQIGTGPSVTWGKDLITSTITVDIKVEALKGYETASVQTSVIINNNDGGGGCNAPGSNQICLAVDGKSLIMQNVQAETQKNRTAYLSWQVEGSDLSSQFLVQHRADSTRAWSTLGTVPVSDSSSVDSSRGRRLSAYRFRTGELEIGTHQFRVGLPEGTGSAPRAVATNDTGGPQRFAGPVTAKITMDEAYRLSTYPNPVQQQATVELAVKERQEVAVRLYDVLGRRVATLHSGPLPAQELRRLRLDVSSTGLTSGTYFLRVRGENFAATEQVTVVR